jgi:hypothetical protein
MFWELDLLLSLAKQVEDACPDGSIRNSCSQSLDTYVHQQNPYDPLHLAGGGHLKITGDIGLGAFAASELDKVFSGYQPRYVYVVYRRLDVHLGSHHKHHHLP